MHSRRKFIAGLGSIAASSMLPNVYAENIIYSSLQRTNDNYNGTLRGLPPGSHITSAQEEFQLIDSAYKADENPIVFYQPLFDYENLIQMTSTTLRIPKGFNPNEFEVDKKGRKYWRRVVLHGKESRGEFMIPESGLIPEIQPEIKDWNGSGDPPDPENTQKRISEIIEAASGLPPKTEEFSNIVYANHIYHYWFFDSNLPETRIYLRSCELDRYRCLVLSAGNPDLKGEQFVFRPKRG